MRLQYVYECNQLKNVLASRPMLFPRRVCTFFPHYLFPLGWLPLPRGILLARTFHPLKLLGDLSRSVTCFSFTRSNRVIYTVDNGIHFRMAKGKKGSLSLLSLGTQEFSLLSLAQV